MADKFQRVNVNTHSITFFNEERFMLKVVYLDDALTITIGVPQIVDGKATYPNELRKSVLVNQANVSAFHTVIMEHVLPAFDKGENKDAGVFTNRNKSQMVEVACQAGNFYLIIHEDIENRVPKVTTMFKFDKTPIIKNYDVKSVSFETEDIDANFALFVKALEAFENLSNGITAHEYQFRQAYFINQVKQLMTAMNTKLGLGLNLGGYSNNNNASSGSGFSDFSAPVGGGNPVSVHQGTMNDLFPGAGDELPFK